MSISQDIQFRRLLHLRTQLDKYEDKTINSTLAIFDKAVTDLKKEIKKPRSIKTKAQQKKLLTDINKNHKLLKKSLTKEISKEVAVLGEKALDGLEPIYSWDGKDPKFNYVSDKALKVADAVENVPVGGSLLSEWVGKSLTNTLDLQRAVISSAILKGESYPKMYKAVAKIYEDNTKRELITLTRTYNQSIVVAAQEKLFEENEDVVKSFRWTAALELGFSSSGRGTCPRCAALDGNEYEKGEPRPPCPLHARCRCMWAPVTLTWNELLKESRLEDKNGDPITIPEMKKDYRRWTNRKEANINLGRGAGNITSAEWTGKDYGQFITAKGGKPLVNAVGPNRAALIESGKINFNDLVNRETGELLTLDELGFPLGSIKTKKIVVPPTSTPVQKSFPSMGAIKDTIAKDKNYKKAVTKLSNAQKEYDEIHKTLLEGVSGLTRNDWYEKFRVARTAKDEAKEALKINALPDVAAIIKPPEGGTIKTTIGQGKTQLNKNKKQVTAIVKDIESMFHPSVLANVPDVNVWFRKNARAHYKNGKNTLRMGNFETDIWVHEYGHHIELNAGLYEKALDFRKSRTIGETLKEIGNTKEYGYEDKFFNHYVGRKYHFDSTEVISMGVQEMYNNPVGFYESDPDYFEFILNVMWGKI